MPEQTFRHLYTRLRQFFSERLPTQFLQNTCRLLGAERKPFSKVFDADVLLVIHVEKIFDDEIPAAKGILWFLRPIFQFRIQIADAIQHQHGNQGMGFCIFQDVMAFCFAQQVFKNHAHRCAVPKNQDIRLIEEDVVKRRIDVFFAGKTLIGEPDRHLSARGCAVRFRQRREAEMLKRRRKNV